MEVAIITFDGVDELDVVGPYEVFENAASAGADLTVTLCTIGRTETVTASHGLEIGRAVPLTESVPDVLVVPGGQWNARGKTGAWAEAQRGTLPETISRLHDQGTTVAGVCTGAMLIAHAGLLRGRPSTTHHAAIGELRETGANVIDARVVDDGDLVTAGGVTSGLDLALHLVEREFGADVATRVSERMEYEPRGQIHDSH